MQNPSSSCPYTFREISIEMMRMHARSVPDLLQFLDCEAAPDAVLPEAFIADWLPRCETHPQWLGIYVLADNVIVGSGGYKSAPIEGELEIGYGVSPEWENRGVATFICRTLVEIAFERGVERVLAHTLPSGLASVKVLSKNGFVRIGTFHDPEDGQVFRFERKKSRNDSSY